MVTMLKKKGLGARMKTLVVYYSKTGNTAKVAKEIAKGFGIESKAH